MINDNTMDKQAVKVVKGDENAVKVVKPVASQVLRIVWYFLAHSGEISAEANGRC